MFDRVHIRKGNGGKVMQTIHIDETKLPKVIEIIEKAVSLMEEKECVSDDEAKKDLDVLQEKLRKISGKPAIDVRDFQEYWEYTDVETVAKKVLMDLPVKDNVTENEIKEIVLTILSHSEAEMDWWLEYLKVNTGLPNLSDYIFYPDSVGLNRQAELGEIADKIIADRKKGSCLFL